MIYFRFFDNKFDQKVLVAQLIGNSFPERMAENGHWRETLPISSFPTKEITCERHFKKKKKPLRSSYQAWRVGVKYCFFSLSFFFLAGGLFKGGKKKEKKTRTNIFFSLFTLKKGNVTVHLRVQCSHRYGAAQPQFTGSSKDCSVTFNFSPSRCRNSRGTADHDVGRTSRDPNQQLGVALGASSSKKNKSNNPNPSFTETSH
ncbi:hypothetical protein B9Z19DRAFT_260684 [Tuber borchii]|uniref:Uncharacterized protein n=1 Tax=Tuber borchii TaxID=42251 RepID=A0A2T6ZLB2_TUBBO|nr:hypothetical protein B9Z19DRAFT_260684 [Tuber borchii]